MFDGKESGAILDSNEQSQFINFLIINLTFHFFI